MSAEFKDIRNEFDKHVLDPQPFFLGDLGAALGILDEVCGGKVGRHKVQYLLTGCRSVKEMSNDEKFALVALVQPVKFEGKWVAQFPVLLKYKVEVVLAESGNESNREAHSSIDHVLGDEHKEA
jgi:hypothetical protein